MGSYSPPLANFRRKSTSPGRKEKGKAYAADTSFTPSPSPIERGRPRESRNTISITRFDSHHHLSPITATSTKQQQRDPDTPPAIPAKAPKRLSNLFLPTSTSPISDYDTDVEHEREGPGGVGLDVTFSQASYHGQPSSSVGSRGWPQRKNQKNFLQTQGIESGNRPVTPAQVNMVREPVPDVPPVPIATLIVDEEDTPEILRDASGRKSASASVNNTPRTSMIEKRGSAASSSAMLNTGPTPPLTPKDRRIACVPPSQENGLLDGDGKRWIH